MDALSEDRFLKTLYDTLSTDWFSTSLFNKDAYISHRVNIIQEFDREMNASTEFKRPKLQINVISNDSVKAIC